MIAIDIPGFPALTLEHLILDFNGTIAFDGKLIDGVENKLTFLAKQIQIHVITADTFGSVEKQMAVINCKVHLITRQNQDRQKLDYLETLGAPKSVCIGNGRNDHKMLKNAALGIAVVLGEGAFSKTIMAADIVTTNIIDALELLEHPLRLTATLRC